MKENKNIVILINDQNPDGNFVGVETTNEEVHREWIEDGEFRLWQVIESTRSNVGLIARSKTIEYAEKMGLTFIHD